MRARAGLAQVLWYLGQTDAAISHWQALLHLNPNDNQGIRYLLAGALVAVDRDDEALRLLNRFRGDATAGWAYTRALITFRKEGASAKAVRYLDQALLSNPYVPEFLLGMRKLPKSLPAYIGMGDETEAISFMYEFGEGWANTPGAVYCLAERWAALLIRQMAGSRQEDWHRRSDIE